MRGSIQDTLPKTELYNAMQGPETGDKSGADEGCCVACNRELADPSFDVCDECAKKLDGNPDSSPKAGTSVDGYDPKDVVRLREANNAHNAAEILASMIRDKFLMDDEHDDLVRVVHGEDRSSVVWPSGPFEWTLDVTDGYVIGSTEFADTMGRSSSEVFPVDSAHLHVEPYNNVSLCFYDN